MVMVLNVCVHEYSYIYSPPVLKIVSGVLIFSADKAPAPRVSAKPGS